MRNAVSMVFMLLFGAGVLFSCSPGKPDRSAAKAYVEAKNLYLARRWDEALSVLRGRDFGDLPAASLLLGKILFFREEDRGAEAVFRDIVEKLPHYEEAIKWLARLLIRGGRPKEAETFLALGLSIDSEDPELLTLLGKARLANRDRAGAIEYFSKAVNRFEFLAEAPLELADLYRSLGMREKCLVQLELAAALLGGESGLKRSVDLAAAELKKELAE